jgi:hypothetical protein
MILAVCGWWWNNYEREAHMKNALLQNEPGRVVLYTTANGKVTVDVFFANDNFWITQKSLSELFGVNIPSVSRHLKNIYFSGELIREATVSKIETVQSEGGRRSI